jgi:hypothetical protein
MVEEQLGNLLQIRDSLTKLKMELVKIWKYQAFTLQIPRKS